MEAVTDSTWKQRVLEADHPVVVDFWAPWCSQCRHLEPVLTELEARGVDVVKVNADENPGTTGNYGVYSLPTLLVIKNGEVAGEIRGLFAKHVMFRKLDELLG